MEKGLEEGMEKGQAEGREGKAYEIAKKMKEKGMPTDMIAEMTGLSTDAVTSLVIVADDQADDRR